MLITIIIILTLLWFFGYSPISGISIPNIELFSVNSHMITLWELLILIVAGSAIGILPNPFRAIAAVLLFIWILSVLGIFTVAGLPNIVVIAIIGALVLSVIR